MADCRSVVVVGLIALFAMLAASPAGAFAQSCGPQWLPGHGVPGVVQGSNLRPISASILWDPDGAGPEEEWLVVGGEFVFAGTVQTSGIARWKPSTGEWAPIGGGIAGDVRALAVLPNNDLVAAGVFTAAGGVPARNIARWDGEAWHPLGAGAANGTNTDILALTVLPSGDLIAGGSFLEAGGVPVQRVARWDGSSWSPLGDGVHGGSLPLVFALAPLPNGDLLVAGRFQRAGSALVRSIAKWDGSAWSGFGQGLRASTLDATVTALHADPDGTFVAGGDFTHAGNLAVRSVARWNGATWEALGSGIIGPGGQTIPVRALAALPDGALVAGGEFTTAGGVAVGNIARWDGSAWSGLGSGLTSGTWSETVRTLTVLPSGALIAGGSVVRAGEIPVASLALWDGEDWSGLSRGTDRSISTILAVPGGGIIAGGSFDTIGGVPTSRIAQWDGRGWEAMGPGLSSNPGAAPGLGSPDVLRRHPSGDIIAGGSFRYSGDTPVNALARWNGAEWSELGRLDPVGSHVSAIAISPTGEIAVAGSFTAVDGVAANHIARFDGASWHPLGPGINGTVHTLAYLSGGELVAGGNFSMVDGQAVGSIARWNGVQWSDLSGGVDTHLFYTPEVFALLELPSGDLVAAGRFDSAGGVLARSIARWDGTTWHPFGPGLSGTTAAWVYDLAIGPRGDLLAVGNLISPGPIAGWDGTSWSAYGPPLTSSSISLPQIEVTDAGEIVVAGRFFTAGGHTSAYLARLSDSGAPWVALHPEPQTVAATTDVVFEAAPAESYSNVSYHWLRNGQPITDGPSGASPGGGTVSGASGTLPSPADGTPAVLTITNVQPSDAGVYTTVVFTNPCGSATSHPATLTVTGAPCPADWNHDALINSADISAYLASWLSSLNNNDLIADFDGSGSVNSADISAFLAAWLDALTHGC